MARSGDSEGGCRTFISLKAVFFGPSPKVAPATKNHEGSLK